MLSKKYYIKIGKIIKENKVNKKTINDFINLFESDNSLFDKEIFLKYIGAE